jgi:hypothetical protein
MWLKQSTAATVVLGPFVDSTDGVTAETALTISQADIRLSKNGGAFAQTNNAAGATHMENGNYSVPLDTTDTGTLGRLRVHVNESGALPVWLDFMVVPAHVYDGLVAGSDNLQVDTVQFNGTNATASGGRPEVNTTHWLGTAAATPTVAGVPEVDITHIKGFAAPSNSGGNGVLDVSVAYFGASELENDVNGYPQVALNAAGLAADAVTEIQTGLATSANQTTIIGYIDTEVAAVLAAVDTEVAAIKAKTDQLTFTVANQLDANALSISGDGPAADNLERWFDGTVGFSTSGALFSLVEITVTNTAGSAVTLTSSGGNGDGMRLVAHGTGNGLRASGGGSSGNGIRATGGASDGFGMYLTGVGIGPGLLAQGGATGAGASFIGGSTSGNGFSVTNTSGTLYNLGGTELKVAIRTEMDSNSADLNTIISNQATLATYVDTEVAAIKAVTDKLDSGLELDGSVYRATANFLEQAPSGGGGGTAPTANENADAWLDRASAVDGYTPRQVLRLISAVLLGKSSVDGTVFRDLADTKARVTATMDGYNRTAVTKDAT